MVLVIIAASPVLAQTTTASIRGIVNDESGNVFPGAVITATNTATGFTASATAAGDGRYQLVGLVPGTYRIDVAAPSYKASARDVTVLVGQTIDTNFRLNPDMVVMEEITVIGAGTAVEMESTEVATNVTRQQIENLPQGNRNFMNFAALAPGVTVSDDEFNKTFKGGAQSANAVNVFVDGVSYKNDVIQGGVVGQDSSRGNPFPQNAVQEFRVLTQNYSAEYQKSSSAIITAVTKSGTNDFSGDVFAFFQDSKLVDNHPLSGAEQPFFERLQTGLSLGGPIMRDRMHFFGSYEGNNQDREEIVRLGGANVPAALRAQFADRAGNFPSDFESTLLFGKISFQPASAHLFDFSAFMRDETDIRGFGGDVSFESAEQIDNNVMQAGLRHQLTSSSWLNEAAISYQTYEWNPQPSNPDLVGRNYFGLIRVGGRDTEQDISQKRFSLRDDITLTPFNFLMGSHGVKVGANFDQNEYEIVKNFVGNPVFNFRAEDNYAFPFEAFYGLGDPVIGGDNTAFGFYVQDDWAVTDRFTANLGFRYDYESDMFPQDWVTPADIRTKLAPFVDADRYFTDGDDRQPVDDMFAPRLGLTYDLFGSSKTVLFGGFGRYYDRILFNNTLDERFRLQYTVGQFRFSQNGAPRDGQPTVAFRPEYLTEAGLQQLLSQGVTGLPEAFLLENDTQAPYSDQTTIGVRQSFAGIVGSLSYGRTQSYKGLTYTFGHRNANGTCCRNISATGYRGILLSNDDLRTWYDAVYLTLERPFTSGARWGGSVAYTYSDAEAQGGDLFSLDFPNVSDYPRRPILGIQDHRLVANALVRLPFNITFGTIMNYGSGYPYDIIDQSAGSGTLERIRRAEGTGDSYMTFDVRLDYEIPLGPVGVGLVAEAFNVTNDEVFNGYDGFIPTRPNVNARFGLPNSIVAGSQRRFQYGVRLRF